MRATILVAATLLAGAIGASKAEAAPTGLAFSNNAVTSAPVQQVSYRRCWYDFGVRVCRRYYGDYDDYAYYDDGWYPGFAFYWGGGDGFYRGGRGYRGGGHYAGGRAGGMAFGGGGRGFGGHGGGGHGGGRR